MARVSQANKKRAAEVIELLRGEYPDVKCALIYEKPHELLIATRLSAQCTDKRVNMVTPALTSDLMRTAVLWAAFNVVLMGGRGLSNGLRVRSDAWMR